MNDQKKPKIDLKARLGKKTAGAGPSAVPPPGPAIPPPGGIPKPPAMAGMSSSPSQPPPRMSPSNPYAAVAPSNPYAGGYGSTAPSNPYAAESVAPVQHRVIQQAIQVELSDEVIEQQKKRARRGYIVTLFVAAITAGIGFTFGGSHERDKGAKAALEGARTLITEIEAADKQADQLNEVLAKASERLGKNEFPEEEISKLGEINIPFDGGHLTDKGIGRFRRDLVTQLMTYANTAQKANDQKEKIQNLLGGQKAAFQQILTQKTDPKVRWSVWIESTPAGPWANMQLVPAAFPVSSKTKVKDKDGKEKDYTWPDDITLGAGKDAQTLKRYTSGDPVGGDNPKFIPVAPSTESMVCPSTTIVRLRQELTEMQTVLKGDNTPGAEKTGFLQMGESVIGALKKVLSS
jgi:hypothetical protein